VPNEKIVVFGASGFIGASLCERLYGEGLPFRASINSFASSARIARLPIEIAQANVLNYRQVREAIRGCTRVVNCAWGSEAAMVKGLGNLIRAAKEEEVSRFIHIGSISVHEGYADQDSVSEDAPPKPDGLYGRIKQRQDRMVFDLHRSGLSSMILAAGRVIGPYSSFLLRAIDRLRSGPIVLVDEGRHPSNHIHVDNLSEAVLAALRSNDGWGQRYFLTEPRRPTWRAFYADMYASLNMDFRPISVSREEVVRKTTAAAPVRNYALETIRGVASAQFRQGLSAIPAFKSLNEYAYKVFTGLNPAIQGRIRTKLERPIVISKQNRSIDLSDPFVAEQVRRTYFAPDKFITRVGYSPMLAEAEGQKLIRSWYDYAHLSDSDA
jgi:nucleoside-diphosphate-sugar epimerase